MRKLILLILTLVILVNLGFASGVRHSARKPVNVKPLVRSTNRVIKAARRHGR